jgi:hypothetical protein
MFERHLLDDLGVLQVALDHVREERGDPPS